MMKMGKWKKLTRHLKKSFACVGCDFIETSTGWPCRRCPRQKLDNPDMHSRVNVENIALGRKRRYD